jgi:hypothetical protein
MSSLVKVTMMERDDLHPVFISNAEGARAVANRFAELCWDAGVRHSRTDVLVQDASLLQEARVERWNLLTRSHREGSEDCHYEVPSFFDEDWYQAIHPTVLAVQRNSDTNVTIQTVEYQKCSFGVVRLSSPQTLGRFLTSWGVPADVVERYVIKSQSNGIEAALIESSEDIADVYRVESGPLHSCMSYSMTHYDTDGIAPVLAYGGKSDIKLFVIRLKESGNVVGRALVWPDKMIHGRIYGRDKACQQALTEAGYTKGSFHGARLNKIPIKRLPREDDLQKVVVPYIDGFFSRAAYVVTGKKCLHIIDTSNLQTARLVALLTKDLNHPDAVYSANRVSGSALVKEVGFDDSKIEEILAA